MRSTTFNILRRTLSPFFVEPEKQEKTIGAIVFFITLSLILFGLRPLAAEIGRLRQEIKQGKDWLRLADQKLSDLQRTQSNFERYQLNQAAIQRILPEGKDLPKLLADLSLIFGRHNLNLEEVRLGETVASPVGQTQALPLFVRASGSYENLRTTLESLEKNGRQIDPVMLSLEVSQKDQRLAIALDLRTFFMSEVE